MSQYKFLALSAAIAALSVLSLATAQQLPNQWIDRQIKSSQAAVKGSASLPATRNAKPASKSALAAPPRSVADSVLPKKK